MNALMYAYLGDAIYEFFIRKYLLTQGFTKPKDLQRESVKYVSVTSQRRLLELLIKFNIKLKLVFHLSELNCAKNSPEIDYSEPSHNYIQILYSYIFM